MSGGPADLVIARCTALVHDDEERATFLEDATVVVRDGVQGDPHRVAGAALLRLEHGAGVRGLLRHVLGDALGAPADHHEYPRSRQGRVDRGQHVADEGTAENGVQDLGYIGLHPLTHARGKNDHGAHSRSLDISQQGPGHGSHRDGPGSGAGD